MYFRVNIPSAIKSKEIEIPVDNSGKGKGSLFTKVVVKENPLFTSDHTHSTCSFRSLVQDENGRSNVGGVISGEIFKGQHSKIRKTKEQEMISAVMGVSKYNGKQLLTQ